MFSTSDKSRAPRVFYIKRFLILLMAISVIHMSGSGNAAQNLVTNSAKLQKKDPTLVLTRGKAETVSLKGAVSDVMVADPNVLEVVALQSDKLYLVGRSIGDTNLIALDAEGNTIKRMNVHVRMDEDTLQDAMKDLFPEETVRVKTLGDQIILTGRVSGALQASRVRDLAQRFIGSDEEIGIVNMLEVGGEQQVTLRVKIVEVSRTVLKELGVETNFNDPFEPGAANPLFDSVPPTNGLSGSGSAAGQLLGNGSISSTAAGVARFLTDPGVSGIGTIEILLSALEEESMLTTLAEPNLTAVSGEEASFLAGGEFPVPSGVDQAGNTVFTYRPFGVTLNFRPTVLSNDRISLQMVTEVSDFDPTVDAEVAGVNLPAFDVNRASTTVEMGSGGSLLIAGLLDSDTIDGYSGLPGMRGAPIIGDLIKSENFRRDETEVLVVVTAFLVEPYKDESYAEQEPQNRSNPLAKAFAAMVRKSYGDEADDLLNGAEMYGYLLD